MRWGPVMMLQECETLQWVGRDRCMIIACNPDQYFRCTCSVILPSSLLMSWFPRSRSRQKQRCILITTTSTTNLRRLVLKVSIGLLKMRFQHLREMRVQLSKKKKHMRHLIQYVTYACIIHNLLIAEPIPQEWRRELDASITGELKDDDELYVAVPANSAGYARRNQLLGYLLEIRAKR
ncbi:hypothetical protein F442_19828 [Phytophthora nicotianae P10297]|uniref:DDE Tnp4 domain-containing protein n=1 Tax=Phytophthora nicotianae P10297 TaxID=1317064 RepID=W2Y9J5_PHYNI|nr:hypothetical protein F442_19828 [Phytophthora nicotianae P10297]